MAFTNEDFVLLFEKLIKEEIRPNMVVTVKLLDKTKLIELSVEPMRGTTNGVRVNSVEVIGLDKRRMVDFLTKKLTGIGVQCAKPKRVEAHPDSPTDGGIRPEEQARLAAMLGRSAPRGVTVASQSLQVEAAQAQAERTEPAEAALPDKDLSDLLREAQEEGGPPPDNNYDFRGDTN